MPSARELGHVAVDLGLCADVDAARRLVEDQHLRAHRQPLAEHDLLLVAAREVHDLLLDARRLGAQALPPRPRPPCARSCGPGSPSGRSCPCSAATCSGRSSSAAPGRAACGPRGRGTRRARSRRAGSAGANGLPVEHHRAAERGRDAEDRLHQLRAPCADEAGEAEDLAARAVKETPAGAPGTTRSRTSSTHVAFRCVPRARESTGRSARGRPSSRRSCRASPRRA